MAYIKGEERQTTCFLCDTGNPDAAAEDEPNLVVARGDHVFVILNRYPYNTGHLMIAPYRHVGELEELTAEEVRGLWDWTTRSIDAHRRTTEPHGFNIGANLGEVAGAGVPGHFHMHVVPRWGGDANFMPVLADAKVLPEMLSDTYKTLRPAFEGAEGRDA